MLSCGFDEIFKSTHNIEYQRTAASGKHNFSSFLFKSKISHYVKSVRIRSYSVLHFPAFGLNTEKCSVSLSIQSECGKIRTRITTNRTLLRSIRSKKYIALLKNIHQKKSLPRFRECFSIGKKIRRSQDINQTYHIWNLQIHKHGLPKLLGMILFALRKDFTAKFTKLLK